MAASALSGRCGSKLRYAVFQNLGRRIDRSRRHVDAAAAWPRARPSPSVLETGALPASMLCLTSSRTKYRYLPGPCRPGAAGAGSGWPAISIPSPSITLAGPATSAIGGGYEHEDDHDVLPAVMTDWDDDDWVAWNRDVFGLQSAPRKARKKFGRVTAYVGAAMPNRDDDADETAPQLGSAENQEPAAEDDRQDKRRPAHYQLTA